MSLLKFFRPKQALVPETSLARFVRHAPSKEKRRVYTEVIRQATEEQRKVIEASRNRQAADQCAHA